MEITTNSFGQIAYLRLIISILVISLGLACGSEQQKATQRLSDSAQNDAEQTNQVESTNENPIEFVPVDSMHRVMFDTCIIDCDTFMNKGKRIAYSCYWLCQDELPIKYFYCNYYFYCYQWKDTTLCYIHAPRTKNLIIDTKDRLTILNCDTKDNSDFHNKFTLDLNCKEIFEVMDTLSRVGVKHFPLAKYNKKGVNEDKQVNPGSWQTNFKKTYTETGVLLTNIDGQRFKYFIKYPFRMKPGKGNAVIKRRAEKLPPFLFCDMVDYFFMFGLQRTFDTDSYFAPADFSAYDE